MDEGVVLCWRGLSPSEEKALSHALTGAACWQMAGDGVCALAPLAHEHLSACVERALLVMRAACQQGAAVGLAVGPLPSPEQATPTLARARRAAALATPGEIILAWGSQAYVVGEFESVMTGFVKLRA